MQLQNFDQSLPSCCSPFAFPACSLQDLRLLTAESSGYRRADRLTADSCASVVGALAILSESGVRVSSFEQLVDLMRQYWRHAEPPPPPSRANERKPMKAQRAKACTIL